MVPSHLVSSETQEGTLHTTPLAYPRRTFYSGTTCSYPPPPPTSHLKKMNEEIKEIKSWKEGSHVGGSLSVHCTVRVMGARFYFFSSILSNFLSFSLSYSLLFFFPSSSSSASSSFLASLFSSSFLNSVPLFVMPLHIFQAWCRDKVFLFSNELCWKLVAIIACQLGGNHVKATILIHIHFGFNFLYTVHAYNYERKSLWTQYYGAFML